MRRYKLQGRNLWGDYGSVLVSGYFEAQEDGHLLLQRTGPFLPPVSFPWCSVLGWKMVVSDDFRKQLMQMGFSELQFRETIKQKIVHVDWHKWDRNRAKLGYYPESGEPCDYIFEQPHEQRLAEQMPLAWEVLAPVIELRYEYEDILTEDDEIETISTALFVRGFNYPDGFAIDENIII